MRDEDSVEVAVKDFVAARAELYRLGKVWDGMTPDQRSDVVVKAGWVLASGAGPNQTGRRIMGSAWVDLQPMTKETLSWRIPEKKPSAPTNDLSVEPTAFTTTVTDLEQRRESLLQPFQAGPLKDLSSAEPVPTSAHNRLMQAVADADTVEGRYRAADEWVKAEGIKADREHMVVFSKDGVPISVTRGPVGSAATGYTVAPRTIAVLYIEKHGTGYTTHNHPGNSAFSPGDIATMATGYSGGITAFGHSGDYHFAMPGEFMPELATFSRTPDDAKELAAFKGAIDELDYMVSNTFAYDYWTQTGSEAKARIAARAALSLFLHRIGVIQYSGDAQRIIDDLGMDFDGFYSANRHAAIAAFRRAGFPVAEVSNPIGDRPGGIPVDPRGVQGSKANAAGSTDKDAEPRDALIPIGPPPTRAPVTTGNNALDGALDDIFGDDSDVSSTGSDLERGGRDGAPADDMGGGATGDQTQEQTSASHA